MTQHRNKRLSIDLLSLPKIRHKSTHVQFQNQKLQKSEKSSFLDSLFKGRKNHKSLSKLQRSLSRHRSEFHQFSSTNHKLLNTTFIKQQKLDEFYQEKKKLQKKKVCTMENPSRFSQNFSDAIKNSQVTKKKERKSVLFNSKKQQSCSGPMIVVDYRIQMSWLRHQCNDSIFQLSRIGASLNYFNNELYLFGGSPDINQNNLMFHKFRIQSNEWKHVNSTGSKPMLSLMYHSSITYKQFIIVSGGISIHKNQLKKFFSPYIFVFNSTNQVWSQYNWGICVKNHSSCMVNNWLFVYGGINEKQAASNLLHIVQLNFGGNFQYSKNITISTSQHLSHHKMITTINEDLRLRTKFKLDGSIAFGGKNQYQQLSNSILFLDSKEVKLSDQNGLNFKKWKTIEIYGPFPQKRMAHTFDLVRNKGLAVLIGGLNQKNNFFSDIWILDLFSLSWTMIEEVPLLIQTGGIAYHSSCINDSQIYIYGGLTKEKVDKQFYLIETQKSKRQAQKNQSRKKIQTSMFSIKNFQ